MANDVDNIIGKSVETAAENAAETYERITPVREGRCWEVIVYSENQVGLLSSIAGMFTRRRINIERLLVYPSQVPGVHKCSIRAWTTEEKVRQIALQLDKKVDVLKVFCYEHPNHSAHEVRTIEQFLAENEENVKH